MSLIETKTGRKFFKKVESMMLVPFVYDNTTEVNDYVLGSDVYDISAIIGDSISLEQKDGEVKEKYNEFVRTPTVINNSAGSYEITAQCLDLQDTVLCALYGAYNAIGGNGVADGVVAMPDDYSLQYAMIRIRFKDENLSDVILPKVKMNSKLLFQQMKTGASHGNIVGSVLPAMVSVVDKDAIESQKVLQFYSAVDDVITYAPVSPILFVPRGYTFFAMHHIDGENNYFFSTVDFATGSVSHNIVVNINEGSYEIILLQ